MTTLLSFPGSLRLLGALLALLLLGCATPSTPPPSSAPEADAVVIKKSAIDTRSYRHRVLPNGLEVLLVSDLASDQAAAALAVDVGSFAEPESHLGLAHFLEHMLFLGTEKFPDPDGYGDFISRNGGDRNAYTALDHTNYFFSIRPEAFFEGLDRFAQFFIAPRFDAAYVSRERNAVHSEYQMQLKNDGWRTYMTQKRALNPAHPGSRFTIGSLDTLADDEPGALREALLAFYEAHYSADRMRLVLLAPESLDTLESWATELFGPVRARPTAVNEPEAPVFAKDQLPSLLRIRPVKERRSLELTFPLPPLDPYQAEAPGAYLSNLLGHEGEGSAHAVLKDAGLINGLSAGAAPFGEHNALFSIAVDLTEAGYAQWPQVTGTLFAAIERLRAEGPQRWRYDEQARLAALAFAYQPQRDAYNTVSALAAGLLEVPPEEILRSGMRMDRFDPVLLESILGALRPDRLQLTLTAPEVETTTREPFFAVDYALEPLSPALWMAWESPAAPEHLALPAPNPFVPEALSLMEVPDAAAPVALASGPWGTLWHAPTVAFNAPRAELRLKVQSGAITGPEGQMAAALWAALLKDSLNSYAYPARLAGLSFALRPAASGLELQVAGYSERLPELLEAVLSSLTDAAPSEAAFEREKARLLQSLANQRQDRPYQQSMRALQQTLDHDAYPLEDRLAAAEALTLAQLREGFAKNLLEAPKLTGLMVGNVTPTEADRLAAMITDALGTAPADPVPPRALTKLEDGDRLAQALTIDHDDAAFVLYVQGRTQSLGERARFGLLGHMLASPYFNALRTERQLGYVVSAGAFVRHSTPGLYFLAQSPVAGPAAILEETEGFLARYGETVAALTPEVFETEKAGLRSRLLERDKNLGETASRYWENIEVEREDFALREALAAALDALTLEQFQAFYGVFLERLASQRILAFSPGRFGDEALLAGTAVTDLAAFKASRDRFLATGGAR